MAFHNIGENALFTTLASGTFINTSAVGGTIAGVVPAGQHEQHLVAFFGTLANNGTINVYACSNSGGSSPAVVATLNVGSANGAGAAVMVKSDVIGGLGSTHLAACGTVESGGTWRGALVVISHQSRSAGSAQGLAAIGSALY
jgi:hypothetical protein